MNEISQLIELENELERELYFERKINKQTNINYLEGYKKGIMERKDIYLTEKKYYCELIELRSAEVSSFKNLQEKKE